MSAIKTQNTLRGAIRAALRQHTLPRAEIAKPGQFARAGLAVALLQAQAAGAFTLGTLEYDSAIGEPLRATATATIASGETLQPGCISTSPYKLGTLILREPLEIRTPVAQQPGQYTIELTTRKPLTEPMYELQLRVACPGAAALTRSYIVMLDAPRGYGNIPADSEKIIRAQSNAPVTQVAGPPANTVPTLDRPVARRASQPGANNANSQSGRKLVNPGQRYTVVKGDTLFGIAARLNERPAGATWAAARLLFDTNPAAFVGGDRNQLKLGAILRIPESAMIANLKPDAGFGTPASPSRPRPERELPARPALVRSEESNRTQTRANEATAGADSAEAGAPAPYALQAAAIAAATEARDTAATQPAPQPAQAEPAPSQDKSSPAVSYPTVEPVSPLLAGLVGMLLGALFATLLFSARRILDSLKRDEWNEAEETEHVNAFDTTDSLDIYEHDLPVGQAIKDDLETGLEETLTNEPEQNPASVELSRVKGDEFPVSPMGTITVEFSELDALAGKTLGFDLADALGDTAEQPKLGESPRINLEGLGSSIDYNRELEEMLEEFGPESADHENIDLAGGAADTDADIDIEDSGEITKPRLDEQTGSAELFNTSRTMLSEDAKSEAGPPTLALKPLSLGLDLDLGLNGQAAAEEDEIDFSLDSPRDKTSGED